MPFTSTSLLPTPPNEGITLPELHLFADISSHGFGHLAIGAPVLNRILEIAPKITLTLRSGLPPEKLRERIHAPFQHIAGRTDFGCVMHNAMHVDHEATAALYRQQHADWATKVDLEAQFLLDLKPTLVLSNVSYLPLAGAARAGIPSLAICSLNWADIFSHYFSGESWAAPIHADILAAYRSAQQFLRITPGMPMPDLTNITPVGPIASRGRRQDLGLNGARAVLISLGGIGHRVPVESWPRIPGIRWLVSADWQCTHPDAIAYESLGLNFTDLLCAVDAVITKPGYGTFTECCCNGTPVLYARREDWPEQDCLIDWLEAQGRCAEISPATLASGDLANALENLWRMPHRPIPAASGADEAARLILAVLRNASQPA